MLLLLNSTGYEAVRLPEDVTLCGFTPLMLNIQNPNYTPKTSDMVFVLFFFFIKRISYFMFFLLPTTNKMNIE